MASLQTKEVLPVNFIMRLYIREDGEEMVKVVHKCDTGDEGDAVLEFVGDNEDEKVLSCDNCFLGGRVLNLRV